MTDDTSIQNWRIDLGDVNPGRRKIRVPLPVQSESVVTVTASEYRRPGDAEGDDIGKARFIGNADIWVSNVAAHGTAGKGNGSVEFVLHCWENFDADEGYRYPLRIVVDITRLHAARSKLGTNEDLTGEIRYLD
jgi:hypothetical protein